MGSMTRTSRSEDQFAFDGGEFRLPVLETRADELRRQLVLGCFGIVLRSSDSAFTIVVSVVLVFVPEDPHVLLITLAIIARAVSVPVVEDHPGDGGGEEKVKG